MTEKIRLHKKSLIVVLFIFFLFSGSGCACGLCTHEKAADALLQTYKKNYKKLSQYKQTHLTIRHYRTSGKVLDKNVILLNVYKSIDEIRYVVENFSPKFVKSQAKKSFDAIPTRRNTDKFRSLRGQKRREAIKDNIEFLFYRRLLKPLITLQDHRLNSSYNDRLINILQSYDFGEVLTSRDIILAWGAPTANYTFWLAELGILDIRKDYINVFRSVYPDDGDKDLDLFSYTNKIYGMTHIIIGASRFYQQWVNYDEYAWIYNYFEKNIDTILERVKIDVIAEVGITFLLAKQENQPAVMKARAAVLKAIKKDLCYIPVDETPDINDAEHRNILAIILLRGIEQLYKGPEFDKDPWCRMKIPNELMVDK